MITLGIDPGLDGAICLLKDGKIEQLILMPTYEIETTKKLKSGKFKKVKYIDTDKLVEILRWFKDAKVYIEKVNSIYGIDANSNFRLGYGIGCIHGVLRAMGMGYTLISPKEWQRVVWLDSDKVMRDKIDEKVKQGKIDTKKTSINAALRIFPDQDFRKSSRSKLPHDGKVDAALIAHVGHILESRNG